MIDVSELLRNWGFTDLIPIFEEQKIDHEAFIQLDNDLIKELIPTVGTRIKFLNSYRIYTDDKKNSSAFTIGDPCSPLSTSSGSTIDCVESSTEKPENPYRQSPLKKSLSLNAFSGIENLKKACRETYHLNLRQYLEAKSTGKFILNSYNKEKKLTRKTRNTLVDVIIKDMLNEYKRLTHEDFENITEKICEVFPTEAKSTYYIPYVGKNQTITNKPISAKGKLIDKYRNLRRIYNFTDREDKENLSSSNISTHYIDDGNISKQWLHYNTEPWPEVIEHWNNTFSGRRSAEYKHISDFISEWPIVKLNESQSLIEEDFKRISLTTPTLMLNWNDFFEKIRCVEIHQDKHLAVQYMNLYDSEIAENSKHAISILLLPSIFPPISRIRSKSKHWKPSIEESRENLIVHIKTAGDIHLNIRKRKEKNKEIGTSNQPYIVIVGQSLEELNSFYVVVDDIIYKVDSVLKALDICFKIYHVFKIRYAPESEHIWLLIQKAIFKMHTIYDKSIPTVDMHLKNIGDI